MLARSREILETLAVSTLYSVATGTLYSICDENSGVHNAVVEMFTDVSTAGTRSAGKRTDVGDDERCNGGAEGAAITTEGGLRCRRGSTSAECHWTAGEPWTSTSAVHGCLLSASKHAVTSARLRFMRGHGTDTAAWTTGPSRMALDAYVAPVC